MAEGEGGGDGGRVRQAVASGVKRVRDRRRRVRQRLEDIFGRETFTSVAVIGAMGKLIETSVVPFLDTTSTVPVARARAWLFVFVAAMVVSLYWERLARAAASAADAAEEAADKAAGESE
jgi:hypothetical protein